MGQSLGRVAWTGAIAGAVLACSVDDRQVDTAAATGSASGGSGEQDVVVSANTGGSGGSPGSGGAGGSGRPETGSAPLRAKPTTLDLLFMIDNSISMSDKQSILLAAVPDLMGRLVNPICLDAAGNELPAPPPGADCPEGQRRQFAPLRDVNVGIISSSLGDFGADVACPGVGSTNYVPDRVDLAHLMGSLERSSVTSTAQGFLAWRAGTTDLAAFNVDFQNMVADVGEAGCGWEASLESWYRFLIDPSPFRELVRVPCPGAASLGNNCVQPATDADGAVLLDDVLLAQRAAFLRDDSAVAIIMLTDENDCSGQVGAQALVAFSIGDGQSMFQASAACALNPNDKCCYTCPEQPAPGCPVDPACTADAANLNRLPAQLDGYNLRCFEQKRRFGKDFLYPTQRYINALTQPQLCGSAPDLSSEGCALAELYPNPLFAVGRSPSEVVLGGIIGVPWQAVASSRDAEGNLITRGDVLRFKPYQELDADGAWAQILGSPGVPWQAATESQPEVAGTAPVPPLLPQMVESSQFPRPGISVGNALNGRDYETAQSSGVSAMPTNDDLQYACIFPLEVPRDCAVVDPGLENCDCFPDSFDRPLCEQTPGVTPPGTTQYWAKAHPGLRQLEVLKGFGDRTTNAVVASICARNTSDPSRADFGYRPAMAAMIERLQTVLAEP